MRVCYSVYVCKPQFVFVFIFKLCGSLYGCVVLDSRTVKNDEKKKVFEYCIFLVTWKSAVHFSGSGLFTFY